MSEASLYGTSTAFLWNPFRAEPARKVHIQTKFLGFLQPWTQSKGEVDLYPICKQVSKSLQSKAERHAREVQYRGTSPIRNRPPPYDPPKTLGTGLWQGPRWMRSLISEVPLKLNY